jgi:hypothetical protein
VLIAAAASCNKGVQYLVEAGADIGALHKRYTNAPLTHLVYMHTYLYTLICTHAYLINPYIYLFRHRRGGRTHHAAYLRREWPE